MCACVADLGGADPGILFKRTNECIVLALNGTRLLFMEAILQFKGVWRCGSRVPHFKGGRRGRGGRGLNAVTTARHGTEVQSSLSEAEPPAVFTFPCMAAGATAGQICIFSKQDIYVVQST